MSSVPFRIVKNVDTFISRYCMKGARTDSFTTFEFKNLLGKLYPTLFTAYDNGKYQKVGIAVSGGPDSMALLGLTVATLGPDRVMAITVFHGSQAEGGEPSSLIQELVRPLGCPHILIPLEISCLSGVKGVIQERCREARYSALRNASLENGLSFIFSGHQLDDDLCTFFMRLSRYSGIEGLAGIRPLSILPGTPVDAEAIQLLVEGKNGHDLPLLLGRPLLGCPKGRLVNTCQDLGLSFLEDLSNSYPEDSLRNSVRDGIQALLISGTVSIEDLYALLHFSKMQREEARLQIASVLSTCVFSTYGGLSWPFLPKASAKEDVLMETKELTSPSPPISQNMQPIQIAPIQAGQIQTISTPPVPCSPGATIVLAMKGPLSGWWRSPWLLMRVLSSVAEGISGRHLQSSLMTMLAFSEALESSANIRARQIARSGDFNRSSISNNPIISYTRTLQHTANSNDRLPVGRQWDLSRFDFSRKLPFIRTFSFGRCIVSPLGSHESGIRKLSGLGPVLGLFPATRMSADVHSKTNGGSLKAPPVEFRMVDNFALNFGVAYLWDGRILLYRHRDGEYARSLCNNSNNNVDQMETPTMATSGHGTFFKTPIYTLKEEMHPITQTGALTGLLARGGGIPGIRVSKSTFQGPPSLWILSQTLGPTSRACRTSSHSQVINQTGFGRESKADSFTHLEQATAIGAHRVRIVPLSLPALKWFASGATLRSESSLVALMEHIRQTHTADTLPQHPLLISMDGRWASAPTLSLSIGQPPMDIRAVPYGTIHVANRVFLPSLIPSN